MACSAGVAARPRVGWAVVDWVAGGKFANADLIGIPYHLIVGPRGLKDGTVELKHRKSGERETLSIEAAVGRLKGLIVPQRRDTV